MGERRGGGQNQTAPTLRHKRRAMFTSEELAFYLKDQRGVTQRPGALTDWISFGAFVNNYCFSVNALVGPVWFVTCL